MRVGAYQFDVRRGDVEGNLVRALEGLDAAAEAGVDLVSLPEMWPTSFVDDRRHDEWLAATGDALEQLRARSRDLGLVACGTAYGAGDPGERPRNRLHVFDDGELVLSYDKVHLFTPTAEELGFSAGHEAPPTVEIRGLRVSAAICYDLRFSALLRRPYLAEAELLVVPAQWPAARAGQWRGLLIGRAIEHQAFVIGANRTGVDRVGRRELELRFPGDSLVAGPDGRLLAEKREPGLVAAEIDVESVRRLREQVPVRRDQALRAYAGWTTEGAGEAAG